MNPISDIYKLTTLDKSLNVSEPWALFFFFCNNYITTEGSYRTVSDDE